MILSEEYVYQTIFSELLFFAHIEVKELETFFER